MSKKIASLHAELSIDNARFDRGLLSARGGLAETKRATADALQSITGLSLGMAGAAGAVGLFASGLKYSIEQAAAAEKVDKQLAAVIKSTGGAANLTASEIGDMASGLSDLTAVEDDTIKQAASVLLTFTKIGREVFPQATQAALDMSAALGGDLQSNILQVGKALNDPIRGVTALQRVGVSFTKDQQELIKSLVETGRAMEAQKLILQELNTEFGGQAAAAAATYEGRLKKLENTIGNVAEELGGPLVTGLSNAAEALLILLTRDEKMTRALESHDKEVRAITGTYEDYVFEMLRAAQAAGKLSDEAIPDQIAEFERFGVSLDDVSEELGFLTEKEYEGVKAAQDWSSWQREASLAAQAVGQASEEAIDPVDTLNSRMNDLKTIIGSKFGDEIESYRGKMFDLNKEHKDIAKRIDDLKSKQYLTPDQKSELENLHQDLWDNRDAMRDLADAHEEAMHRMAFNMLVERASSDGLTENELKNLTVIGQAWGLYDEKTAQVIDSINENIDELDTSNPANLLGVLRNIFSLPTEKTFNFTVNIRENGSFPNPGAGDVGLIDPGTPLPVEDTDTEDVFDGRQAHGGPIPRNSILFNEDPNTRPEVPVMNGGNGGWMLTKQDAQEALAGAMGQSIVINVYGVSNPIAAANEVKRILGRQSSSATKSGMKYQGQ